MDSLSVGISVLCSHGKKTKLPGLKTVSRERLPSVVPVITIPGNSDHDPLELVITMLWK
jgi:hypothetical protein